MQIGILLRCFRKANNIKASQLARIIGINKSTYYRVEKGFDFDIDAAKKMLDFLFTKDFEGLSNQNQTKIVSGKQKATKKIKRNKPKQLLLPFDL